MFALSIKYILLTVIILIAKLKANVIRDAEENVSHTQAAEHHLTKRGHSGGEYGPPIHITSSVLQLSNHPSTVEVSSHVPASHYYEAVNENPWKPSTIVTTSYGELWLDKPETHSYDHQLIHTIPDEAHVEHSNSIFSSDIGHTAGHIILPVIGGHDVGGGGLHTHASSGGHEILHLSDNLDFHNSADLKIKHY